MKSAIATVLGLLLLSSLCPPLHAAVPNNDHLVLQKGKVQVFKSGKSTELKEKLTLSNGFKVETNGLVTLSAGVKKQLRENQKLTLDGFLIAPDGKLVPFEDHVTVRNGAVTIVKDGQAQPVYGTLRLEDGTQILPRGIVIRPNGQRTRLLDGQMLRLSGRNLPANDFVMIKSGVVTLQKDGATMTLAPKRSMMMADGTKVLGNGTVIKPDGTKIVLKEGERYNLPGAALSKPR